MPGEAKKLLATEVSVGYKINNVCSIDCKSETASLDFTLIASWHDRELDRPAIERMRDKDSGKVKIDWASVGSWSPWITVQNGVEVEEVGMQGAEYMDESAAGRRLNCDGSGEPIFNEAGHASVKWTARLRGSADQSFPLRDFPFDTQRIVIVLRPRFGIRKIELKANPEWQIAARQSHSTAVAGWFLQSDGMSIRSTDPQESLHHER
jgi:hypothetical protein